MMSRFRVTGFGLLLGGMAFGCTVTTDEGGGSGGNSAETIGGQTSSTAAGGAAGTATASGGLAGATPTGGTAGTSGGSPSVGAAGSANGLTGDPSCDQCLQTDCSADYSGCAASCVAQFNQIRQCILAKQDAQTVYDESMIETCVDEEGLALDIDSGTNALIGCATKPEYLCDTKCFQKQ